MIRFFQSVADAQRIFDHLAVLGHAGDRACDIKLLVAARTDAKPHSTGSGVVTALTGEDQHRDRIQPPAYHTGNGVGSAGTGRHAYGGDPSLHTGISFGGNGARLLMVIVKTVQTLFMTEGVVQVHGTATGNGETVGDSVTDQKVGNVIGKTHFHVVYLPCSSLFRTKSWKRNSRRLERGQEFKSFAVRRFQRLL